jgi:hypothetical protein
LRRTDKTVVERISRCVGMSAIFDYNSAGIGPCGPEITPAFSFVYRVLR